ncbi:MAG TPA: hypothetical protein PKO22_09185 [Treponemataceae bacterium]|nr:hypothetical protein [Treponemataceae bacterium]
MGCNTGTSPITPINNTTYDCIKLAGTTAINQYDSSEIGLSADFAMTQVADLTSETYTVSFDAYVPSSAAALSNIQILFFNESYGGSVYMNPLTVTTNAWHTYSFTVTAANKAYGSLLSDAKVFRFAAHTASAGTAAEVYIKNVAVTNGTASALAITVTPTSDYTGTYISLGNGTVTTTTK